MTTILVRFGLILCVGVASQAASVAAQDSYPTRPIRMLVPFPPGGAPDILARTIGEKLGARLGQRVVAENRPGAGGNIASEAAAKAAPDGYTLYLAAHPPFTLNPILYSNAPYDAIKDFAPVALIGAQWFVLAVNPAIPARTIREFVAYAKSRPGQLSYGSSGAGTPHHLGIEFLKLALGLDIVHVPYKGAALVVQDLVNGSIPVALTALTVAGSHLTSGKLIPLAITSRTRSAKLPEVPTIAETVVPDYEVTAWFGVVAPARTNAGIVDRLNREIVATMRDPELLERMNALGLEARTSTPREMAAVIEAEVANWARVVKDANLKIE